MLAPAMLTNANLISPTLKRFRLSNIKVEKVVKLPKIPINKNSFRFSGIFSFPSKINPKPIKNEPSIFTNRVPRGKVPQYNLCGNADKTYLRMAPILPPNARYRNFIVLFKKSKIQFSFFTIALLLSANEFVILCIQKER